MDARAFQDWSPASVFGATVSEKVPSRYHGNSSATVDNGRMMPLLRDNNHEDLASTTPSLMLKILAPEEQDDDDDDNDGNEHSQSDYAARILQKHARVWLLYRRERESLEQVEQLRRELEQVAGITIIEWLKRTRRRYVLMEHAIQLSKQRENAIKCLVRWLYWQRCISRARRTLQRRIMARHRLVWWWRRVAVAKRCNQRRIQKAERDLAYRLICRFVRRFVRWQRTRQCASQRIESFLWRSMIRRHAAHAAQRRRNCHGAILRLHQVATCSKLRQAVAMWRQFVWRHREAEARRRHHAACVLQRLVRVVLTAFRLMRRRDAATAIQCRVRVYQAQREYSARRRERRRRAATHIQRVARGFVARKRFARLLQQLRERFKCQNCGLIEPGGLYCKFCGRRRTTFDVLHVGAVAASCTTDAKLRNKRRKGRVPTLGPPPAPQVGVAHQRESGPSVWVMAAPEIIPHGGLPAVNVPPRVIHQDVLLPSPIPPPRKPGQVRAASGRPAIHHRSLSLTHTPVAAPLTGVASVDKTRQRAEALLQRDLADRSATMELHLKRLQKGGKAASR